MGATGKAVLPAGSLLGGMIGWVLCAIVGASGAPDLVVGIVTSHRHSWRRNGLVVVRPGAVRPGIQIIDRGGVPGIPETAAQATTAAPGIGITCVHLHAAFVGGGDAPTGAQPARLKTVKKEGLFFITGRAALTEIWLQCKACRLLAG